MSMGQFVLSDGTLVAARVLVADSVFEDAQVTIREGVLYIEFDAEDLNSISLELGQLTGRGRSGA